MSGRSVQLDDGAAAQQASILLKAQTAPPEELRQGIRDILDAEPYAHAIDDSTTMGGDGYFSLAGTEDLPRLRRIVALFCGNANTSDICVVDSAPGVVFQNGAVLAAMGCNVVLEESWGFAVDSLGGCLSRLTEVVQERMHVVTPSWNTPQIPADILMCGGPDRDDIEALPIDRVLRGGFVMIHEDGLSSPWPLLGNPGTWQQIYSSRISGLVMATAQYMTPYLHIFRRM